MPNDSKDPLDEVRSTLERVEVDWTSKSPTDEQLAPSSEDSSLSLLDSSSGVCMSFSKSSSHRARCTLVSSSVMTFAKRSIAISGSSSRGWKSGKAL